MSKDRTTQEMIPGTDVPLTVFQERALEYLDKKADAKHAAEEAKEAKVEVVKVRNRRGDLIIFNFSNDVKIQETHMTDRKVDRAETEAASAAGAGGN